MSSESGPEGYRRRTRWPALSIIGALALATVVTWIVVLKPEPAPDNSCNPPGAVAAGAASDPQSTGATAADTQTASASSADSSTGSSVAATGSASAGAETTGAAPATTVTPATTATTAVPATSFGIPTDRNTLRDVRPANPATVQLRIVNASTTPGMAKTVTETLRKAGFDSVRTAADDTLYPASDLRCWGEIRYGPAGSQAARSVLIVAPCATLILDNRFDDSVEFALGALYKDATLSLEQQAELEQLKQASIPPAVIEGVTQAVQPAPTSFELPATAGCPA